MVRTIGIISSLIALILLSHCDRPVVDDCLTYDYSNCETIKPENGKLYIKLLTNKEIKKVPVKIYKGLYEEGNMILDTLMEDHTLELDVPLDQYYSVKASYPSENKTIHAIDGAEVYVKSFLVCDSTCYVVKDGFVNVRLYK